MKCPCGNSVDLTAKRDDYCKECNMWIDRQLEEFEQREANDKDT